MNNEKGLSLIEVLAAVAISAIVLGAAAALFTATHNMGASSSRQHTLDADKTRIAGLFANRFSAAVRAEIGPSSIVLHADGVAHQLKLSSHPDRSTYQLAYSNENTPTPTLLSDHIAGIACNGMNLININETDFLSNGERLQCEIRLALPPARDSFTADLKLLEDTIDGQTEH